MSQYISEKLIDQPTEMDQEFKYYNDLAQQDHSMDSILCGDAQDFQSRWSQSNKGSDPLFNSFEICPSQSQIGEQDAVSGFQEMKGELQSASESNDGMNKRKATQRMKINKRRAKRYQEQSDEEEEDDEGEGESFTINNHIPKKKKIKKLSQREQYPTKNFLPTFRTSFINYLEKNFQDEENKVKFLEVPVISKIKRQKCINLKDYEQMFKQQIFKPILQRYFDEGVIYRDLMGSRVDKDRKLIYLKKIWVFEQAFKTGVFGKINYHQKNSRQQIAE